jgi:signal transduction histidine kinase
MPPEIRQNRPDAEPAPAVLAQVWHQAPVGLAVLADGGLAAWNEAARGLLESAVGGGPTAWARWLEAACVRLLDSPAADHVLPPRREGGPSVAVAGERRRGGCNVVLLQAAAGAPGRGSGGLAETVSTLSHELRTPLASIKSSLSLLLAGDAGPLAPEQARFVGLASRNVARLDRLVCDLLDLSRDDAGRLRLDLRPVDLGPVLREAVALGEGGEGPGGPRIDAAGLPEHFTACVDPDRVTQIVANLVGNARKYVPADGRVRVWLDTHPPAPDPLAAALARACAVEVRQFTLVVEDNGPGVDPQVIDRVFEPFERGRAEVIGRIGGAGLGLHIVRRLAEAHGGRVSLVSAPGAGTTVWVRLPVDAAGTQLLRAAAGLRAELETGPAVAARAVAVWNGREAGPAAVSGAVAALANLPTGAAGPVCEPATGCLAVAVHDPGPWSASAAIESAGWRLLPLAGLPRAGGEQPGFDRKPAKAPADTRA